MRALDVPTHIDTHAWTSPLRWAVMCSVAPILLGVVYRLVLGVDFSDESWYVATIQRFLTGGKPYVDEIFLMQGYAILAAPVVKLLGGVNPQEGIVLFCRVLYLLFNLSVGIVLAIAVRPWIRSTGAIGLACIWIAFIPYSIPNLSYNTMGLGFLTLAFSCSLFRCVQEKSYLYWAGTGLCMGLAFISHPSMLLTFLCFIPAIYFVEYDQRVVSISVYILSALLPIVLVVTLYQITVESIYDNYIITMEMNTAFGNRPGLGKVLRLLQSLIWVLPIIPAGYLWLGTRKEYRKYSPYWCLGLIVGLVPVAYFFCRSSMGGSGPHGLNWYIGLLAPFIMPYLKDRSWARVCMIAGWFPITIAAFMTSLTSYNGLTSGGVPMAVCSVITFVLLSQWWTEESEVLERTSFRRLLYRFEGIYPIALIPAVSWGLTHTYLNIKNIYYEDALPHLTRRIESGPFMGLSTSDIKAQQIEDLQAMLAPYWQTMQHSQGNILFYPTFPAGYLMTYRKPLLPTVWGCMGIDSSVCLHYLESHKSKTDLWVRVNNFYYYDKQQTMHSEKHFLDDLAQFTPNLEKTFELVPPPPFKETKVIEKHFE